MVFEICLLKWELDCEGVVLIVFYMRFFFERVFIIILGDGVFDLCNFGIVSL